MILYRIVTKNKKTMAAYAEKIKSYDIVPDRNKRFYCTDNHVIYEDKNNRCFACDLSDIVKDPVIISHVSGQWLYKIQLTEVK